MRRRLSYKSDIVRSRKLAVGLLGGSFDPAHDGHFTIASYAKKRLGLRQIWWLPTRQNPLKPDSRPYDKRVASVRTLLTNKSHAHRLCEVERKRGLSYSWQVFLHLRRRYRGVSFVWLMGADCWRDLPHWRRWRWLFRRLPLAIFARAPYGLREVRNPAAVQLRKHRIKLGGERMLRYRSSGWVYFSMRKVGVSSSDLRGQHGG